MTNEHDEQVAFVDDVLWNYKNHPDFVRLLFFATLNGAWLGGNSFAVWHKHEAEGAVKGVSDILYLQPRGKYHYLCIEMKRPARRKEKDGGVTQAETLWMLAAGVYGYTAVCYNAEEAMNVFNLYMSLPINDNRPD